MSPLSTPIIINCGAFDFSLQPGEKVKKLTERPSHLQSWRYTHNELHPSVEGRLCCQGQRWGFGHLLQRHLTYVLQCHLYLPQWRPGSFLERWFYYNCDMQTRQWHVQSNSQAVPPCCCRVWVFSNSTTPTRLTQLAVHMPWTLISNTHFSSRLSLRDYVIGDWF